MAFGFQCHAAGCSKHPALGAKGSPCDASLPGKSQTFHLPSVILAVHEFPPN